VLQEIRIRGLGVISDAVLEFGPGLTVVTGETGAGKTMVVSGLALLFGGRADLSRLRPGVDTASVEGRLSVNGADPVSQAVLDAGGDIDTGDIDTGDISTDNIPTDRSDNRDSAPGDSATRGMGRPDATLILRRVLSASGRSRAVAGGASVPASLLARLAADLVVVHGQSDQLRLTQPAEQRATLDRYAGLDTTACRAAFARWQEAQADLDRRRSGARELAREADLLRAGLVEIDAASPQPGEDSELAELSGRLEHADALRAAAREAHDALTGDPDATDSAADVQSLLAAARRALDLVSGTDSTLDGLAKRVAVLSADATDIAAELAGYEAQLDADPDRLGQVFNRRAVLNSLTRKYGPELSDVLEWAEAARRRLAETDTSEDALADLAAARDKSRAGYATEAGRLSKRRRAAAKELSALITTELAGLAMPAARVQVEITDRLAAQSQPQLSLNSKGQEVVGAGPDGTDEVEFTLQPHPDAPALPIQRGASGGELSRVMLAIEVVLAGTDPVPTMVFDEVDAGVGGRAAVEIGRRLASLSRKHQVIVVTHLAQVAAYADRHLVVDKRVGSESADDGVTVSDIRAVTGPDRVAELARMLAGADTVVARRHAEELLDNARGEPQPAGHTG
jgi:DNA repair protein RecN (Recombination protein N)